MERLGSIGKPVTYEIGKCMQKLRKLWKEYESSQTVKSSASFQNGPTLEIRIPAKHVIATNPQHVIEVDTDFSSLWTRKRRQQKIDHFDQYIHYFEVRRGWLWGTDIYTDDSDLVTVLMHTGYCRPTASPLPSAIQELRAVIRVLPPQDCYIATVRNYVRSRSWGLPTCCSYRVERCCIVKEGGGIIKLEPSLTHASTVGPTIAPVLVERTITTTVEASNTLCQRGLLRDVMILYNLCNEPWTKYSISAVADKGLKRPLYTSARLKRGEVLYLESHSCRYELCFSGEKMVTEAIPANQAEVERSQSHYSNTAIGEKSSKEGDNVTTDVFRWSRCKKPLPQKLMRSMGIPLPLEHVEVLDDNLDWEDIEWSQSGVWISGKEYPLVRIHFLSPN